MWISIDMEGIGGVAAYSHVMMQGVEYERARRWMADEANACIEGAANGGATRAKPLVPKGRNEVELHFLTSAMADMAELIPATRRSGARAVAYGARDYLEVYKAMLAMVRIAPAAVPPEQT